MRPRAPVQPGMCSKSVLDGGRWPSFHNCTRKAKVMRDGKGYCTTHDPVAQKAKSDASYAEFRKKMNRETNRDLLGRMAPRLLDACRAALVAADMNVVLGPENVKQLRAMVEEAMKFVEESADAPR